MLLTVWYVCLFIFLVVIYESINFIDFFLSDRFIGVIRRKKKTGVIVVIILVFGVVNKIGFLIFIIVKFLTLTLFYVLILLIIVIKNIFFIVLFVSIYLFIWYNFM